MKTEVAKPPPVGGKTFKELKAEAEKKPVKRDSQDSFEMFEPDFGESFTEVKEEKKEETPKKVDVKDDHIS